MTNFNSPISKKTSIPSSLRSFVVSDEEPAQDVSAEGAGAKMSAEEELSQLEARMRQLREDKAKGVKRLAPEEKTRLNFVSGIGRITREVKIDNYVFVLRTLKSKEIKNIIFNYSQKEPSITLASDLEKEILATSIFQLNGTPIEDVIESNLPEERFNFVEELDEYVLTKLLKEYEILTKEAKEKYGLNTPEQVKEVVEDVKKA